MASGLLTVVFVDVERSTELLTELGDAQGIAAIDGVLSGVRERIEPYGGRTVKSLGDGLMIVFAGPRDAISFAVAVQRSLAGRLPRVRIGVNTGEVLGIEDDPVGEAVNAAARIAAKAEGGEVLVSDVVRQLVGSVPGMRLVDRGRTRLKGFPERWRLFAVTGTETAPGALVAFGREAELAAVDWLFAGLAQGTGRALILEGEAGIGKTHLAGAVEARALAAGATVLCGGADELEQDRPGRILVGLAKGLDLGLNALLAEARPSDGGGGFVVIEAVVDAVEDAAALRPIVVITEDLHWADELSLRGIAALGRRIGPLPVALVATRRPSPKPPLLSRVLATVSEGDCRQLRLSGLDDAAVASLVASLTGAAAGPTLSARLRGAAGNPLFVTEMVRALDEDGVLRVEGGVADTDDRSLPPNVRDTVVRRLSSLPAGTVELLRLASLLGGEFTIADLATIAGTSVVDVAAHLHEPVDAGILTGEGNTLSFRHDLIREAVYDDLAPAIRRDLHAAAGRSLAAVGAPVSQVARQLFLGARPGDVAAVEWLERAAHESLTLDIGTGIALFERALELAPQAWGGRMRIEASLLEPLAMAGRPDEARARGGALLEQVRGGADEFAVRTGLAAAMGYSGDLVTAATHSEAAAAAQGAPPDEARRLRCVAAALLLMTGKAPEETLAVAEGALAEADSTEDDQLACVAHQAIAMAAAAQGRYDDAVEHARRSRQLLDAAQTPWIGWVAPHIYEAVFLLFLDRDDEAVDALGSARRRAERRGQLGHLPLVHAALGGVHFMTGRWDEAVAELEAGLALTGETGNEGLTLLCHALLAAVCLARGDLSGADGHLSVCQDLLAGGVRHLFGVDLAFWVQARVHEARGDADTALSLLEAIWYQTANVHFLLQYRNLAPDLVRLNRAAGNVERAREIAAEMESAEGRSTAPSVSAAAFRGRGLAEGDADLLVESVATYRTTPRRIDLAEVCEEAAVALFDAGRDDEAAKLLDEAAAIWADLGADAFLGRVDAQLRARGIRRRRRGPGRAAHGWGALSPAERRVVDLVATGLSNPQIGGQLYISRRTVETHLAHIFQKLGVSSRTQVAAMATERRLAGQPEDNR